MCMLCAAGYPGAGETIIATTESSGIAAAGWLIVGASAITITIARPIIIENMFRKNN